MLHDFITDHHDEIITRARTAVALRVAPRPTPLELDRGLPLFLTQLVALLQPEGGAPRESVLHGAAVRGGELLTMGFTVAQVVHDYGDICQAITGLAGEKGAAITVQEFRTLNQTLDDAIAGAVTAYASQRDRWITDAETERMRAFAHEVRNLLSAASLAFELLKTGSVGPGGSTGLVLGRSLSALRDLVDRKLSLLRLDEGQPALERVPVAELVEELEIAATVEARRCGIVLVIGAVADGLCVAADRQILAAGVATLVSIALSLTPRGGEVSIRIVATDGRVAIEIEDQCPTSDRSAGDLPLAISRRAIAAHAGTVRMRPLPRGCLTIVDLPRMPAPS